MKLVLRGLAAATLVALAGCNQSSGTTSSSSSTSTTATTTAGTVAEKPQAVAPSAAATAPAAGAARTTASGLQIEELVVGTGDTAVKGKTVSVHYTGWLSTKT